jgi:hypothetical protein
MLHLASDGRARLVLVVFHGMQATPMLSAIGRGRSRGLGAIVVAP